VNCLCGKLLVQRGGRGNLVRFSTVSFAVLSLRTNTYNTVF